MHAPCLISCIQAATGLQGCQAGAGEDGDGDGDEGEAAEPSTRKCLSETFELLITKIKGAGPRLDTAVAMLLTTPSMPCSAAPHVVDMQQPVLAVLCCCHYATKTLHCIYVYT